MKPFVLKQHEISSEKSRELRAEEIAMVGGAQYSDSASKSNTCTVSSSGGGCKDDGADEG